MIRRSINGDISLCSFSKSGWSQKIPPRISSDKGEETPFGSHATTPKPTKCFVSPEPLALRPPAHMSRGVVIVSSLVPRDSFLTARAQLASGLYADL